VLVAAVVHVKLEVANCVAPVVFVPLKIDMMAACAAASAAA
jgi:hypothetical protein